MRQQNINFRSVVISDAVRKPCGARLSCKREFFLFARLREDAPLNVPDTTTFYGGGAAGYTDYPTLDAALA